MYLSRKPSHKSHVAIWFLDLPPYRSLSVFRKKVAAANFHEWHCADALSPGSTFNSKRNGMRIIQRILNIGNYLIEIVSSMFCVLIKNNEIAHFITSAIHSEFCWLVPMGFGIQCIFTKLLKATSNRCCLYSLYRVRCSYSLEIYISLYVYIFIHVSNPYLSISLSLNSLNSTI